MAALNNIFSTMVLCLLLLWGCSESQEKKALPAFHQAQYAGKAEQDIKPYYAGLIEEYKTILAQDPINFAALVALGNAYYDSSNWQDAIAAYERALKIDPQNADVRTDMGTSYRNLGQYDRALAEYRLALKYDPDHLNARYNIGVVYADDKKNYHAAIQIWEEVLKKAPNYPQSELLKSRIESLKKAFPKAEK